MFCKPIPRGEETRSKLLQAGLSLFGLRGFDGVSARELAAAAGTPLSAVTYHFGSMETLYTAVVQQMIAHMEQRLAPALQRIAQDVAQARTPPEQAIDQVSAHMVQEIVCNQDHPEWAMLMVREHLSPGPAFDWVYQSVMLSSHALLCQLFAQVRGAHADDEAIQLAALAHMGQIVFFRIAAESLKKRLGWAAVDQSHLQPLCSAIAFKA